MAKKVKKAGRPKNVSVEDIEVNETSAERLEMEQTQDDLIANLTKQWKNIFSKIGFASQTEGVSSVMEKWNKLNPFLQNQRIKNLYTQARKYGKANISDFLANPANSETQLRSLAWSNSS